MVPGAMSTGSPRAAMAAAAAARASLLNPSRAPRAEARRSAFDEFTGALDMRWCHAFAATISFDVITREPRVIQYSRGLAIEPRSRGVLDTPLSRGMTEVAEDEA